MDHTALFDEFTRRDWQTTEEGTVRYALVGLGWWTTDEAIPAIREADLCETTVLVSSSTEKAREVADEKGVPRAISYDEFHDGEAADAYDVAYVATPNATHLEFVETAADLGKAVLCEKPMEATIERAERLVDVCNDADVPLMVGYRMQTEPAIRRARELVREGFVGDPRLVHGNNSQRLLDMIDDPDQWRLDPDLSGYGTSVMDIGIYPINTARFLLDSDPVAVQARMDSRHEAFEDVPDEMSAFTLEFEDGVYATCTASQNAYSDTNLRIVGAEGKVSFQPAFNTETDLAIAREETRADFSTPGVNQMTELFDYFADRVLTDADVHPDGEHGVVDMRTIRAIHEAADTGGTVDVA
jgi:xylose dehydrogenase (NAD/NADP)